MSNIYDFTLLGRLVSWYSNFAFKHFYGEFIVIGKENIPADSPIIFAPNHIDALMDALAVHSIATSNLPVVFLARSDLFKNKKLAKLLHFLRMLPAFRMRDGMENLGKNNEIFERCVDVLHHNKVLGIMPEGNQGEERKLRPFSKGLFRIAFAAQKKYGTKPTVKIIPVGIDIGDLVKYGKHIIINVGKPIEVSEYMLEFDQNTASTLNKIRDRLSSDLSDLTLNLATDNHYQCFEIAIDVVNTSVLNTLNLENNTFNKFLARQKTAEILLLLEKNDACKLAELNLLCDQYAKGLHKMNLKTWTLEQKPYHFKHLILDSFLLLVTFPIFVYGFLLNVLPFMLPVVIRKAMKVEFVGFYRSIQFAIASIFTFPLFYLLQTFLFSQIFNSLLWLSIGFFVSQFFVGKWAFKWYREAKKISAKIRYIKFEKNNSEQMQKTQSIRKKIIQLINN